MVRLSLVPAALRGLALILALFAAPVLARADGYYAALDWSASQPMAVLSIDRGPWTMASSIGRGTDGLLWAKGAALRVWSVGGMRLKAGPSVMVKEWPEWMLADPSRAPPRPFDQHIGLRAGADRYADRGRWSSYWMVEYDTTQRAALALVSADWKSSGLGAELSVWREAGEAAAPTVLGRWKMPGRDVSLRLGWRVRDREAFLGVSVARFH